MYNYLDRASIGVGPALEQLLEEGLVEIVDGVIKGQEHKLGDVLWLVAPRDV